MARRASGEIPPSMSLGEAFEAVKTIDEKGGGTLPLVMLATHLKYSPTSSGFRLKVGNLKQFGLVSGSGDSVTLTDLGQKIAAPTSENGLQIYYEPFQKIEMFDFLHKRYSNKQLPAHLDIKNLLIQEKKFDKDTANTWATRFLDSAQAAKLIHSDGGRNILLARPAASFTPPALPPPPGESASGAADSSRGTNFTNLEMTVILIALGDGKKAEIRFPEDITSKQIDKIIKTIEAQRPDDQG